MISAVLITLFLSLSLSIQIIVSTSKEKNIKTERKHRAKNKWIYKSRYNTREQTIEEYE